MSASISQPKAYVSVRFVCHRSQIDFEEEVGYLNYFISQNAYASVVTKSCSELVEKENLNWTLSNRAQEYVASFGASQLGIRYAWIS